MKYNFNINDLYNLDENAEHYLARLGIGYEELFIDLILDRFDIRSFIKLSHFIRWLLWHNDNYELIVKMAHNLINVAKKEIEKGSPYSIEIALGNLYEMLGYVYYDRNDSSIFPYRLYGRIKKNNALAIHYFEKAYILNPSNIYVCFSLRRHYFLNGNYNKSFYYLKNIWEEDNKVIYDYELYKSAIYMYTELGMRFNHDYHDETSFDVDTLFFDGFTYICFRRAHILYDAHILDIEEDKIIKCIYNYAYIFIKGIGIKSNIKKGLKLLKDLDSKLTEEGKSIYDVDDYYGIIKDYYKR